MSIVRHSLKAGWARVLIPLAVLTLYFVFFSWFLRWLLPEYDTNVNAVFVNGAWKVSLAAAGLYVILLSLRALYVFLRPRVVRCFFVESATEKKARPKTGKTEKAVPKNSVEKLDLILVLLPLTPVVQYILRNQDILSTLGSLYVLAVFLAFSVLVVVVIPSLLRITGAAKTLMILGMAFTFTITNMASLSAEFHWLEEGSLDIQVLLLSAAFSLGWILYRLVGRNLLYLVVAVFFVGNSILAAINGAPGDRRGTVADGTDARNALAVLIGSRRPVSTPSIYLLVYDAYVINETMLEHGVDNSAQEEYLETLGFEIYPHTYSVGASSLDSMSRVLNASTDFYGAERRGVSGDGVVQNLLKSFGYETCGVFFSDYFFQGIGSSYDFSFPEAPSSSEEYSAHELLTKSIFMGEFRFDVEFDALSSEQFLRYRLKVLADVPEKPRFVYMHCADPNHAQLSGVCRPDEIAIHEERLNRANYQMKQDLESIMQWDPGAIVVVAGDHGPYLTKNCRPDLSSYDASEISRLDVQDRFGAFLAIRWPSDDFSEYDDITVLQDLFPAVFAYLFEDVGLLETRVEPRTLDDESISGVSVEDGIIRGGLDDGQPLFLDER